MNPQKTAASGGRKNKVQKDVNISASEQNNNNNNNVQKKSHINVNVKDSVNNNIVDSQPKTEKEKTHAKPTAEQIRIAQITELKSGNQDPTHEKVIQLMELSERSEEDACLALYECDNDVERAVVYLLENLEIGAVITTSKKKKNKASAADDDDPIANNHRESPRDERGSRGGNQRPPAANFSKGGKPSERGGGGRGPRPSGGDRGGGVGESHNSDRQNNRGGGDRGDRPPRAMNSNASRRGGGFSGVRGGRGGRIMGRGAGRDQNNFRGGFRSNNQQDQQEIDNWDPASTQNNTEKNDETWGDLGDWDNEEYTGSLSDTKVFTPSSHVPGSSGGNHDISAPPGLEQTLLQNVSTHSDVQQYSAAVSSASSSMKTGFDQSSTASQLRQALEIPQTLTAEQSQYFNTLSSQNNNMVQYGFDDQSGVNQPSTRQQQRTRARMPPPSKIPSTAVEMPGDMNVYLGVQFGELDFGTGPGNDETYDNDKYGSSAIDQNSADDYTLKSGNGVSSKSVQSTGLTSLADSNVESLSSGYQRSSTAQSTLDQLNVNQKSGGYQSGNYGSNFTQSSTNYGQSSNNYGYSQSSYQQGQNLVQNTPQTQSTNGSNGISSGNTNSTGYMSNQYPSNQASFSSQPNNFQNQSVYSSNNSDSNNTVSGSSSSTISTSTINTSSLGLTKSAATSKTSQASSATGVTGTTNSVGSSAANSANNVVQNIPLVSSFIQPGYYQQSPYLHFEDMQLVQPRMTPMTGYYEYQPPTSLGTGRDGTSASNLASVAYPMTADGRFARTDNNSSPVQSQQTGSSQQLMNIPPYAYFYGTNVMPSGFQQFPQIYSQMQVTNPNAGQFAKQTAYSSGYGSTSYDGTVNQTNQDYKTAYQGAGQQSKGSNQTASSSELSSSMYNKNHVTLNKVNSYDKQSFHSGTPPPFMAGSQASSQTQAFQQHLYLQPMAPHHNINMHQPIHNSITTEGTRLSGSRRDSNNAGQRQQMNSQTKGTKTSYQSPSYWNTQN